MTVGSERAMRLGIATCCATLLAATVAHAQAPAPAPALVPPTATTQATAAADVQFTKGRELKKAGKWGPACSAFEQSQRLDPQMGTLFNIAECDTHIGKLASAWSAYRDIAQHDTNAGRRDKASQFVADLEPRLARLLIKIDPPIDGVVITMNGIDVTGLAGVESPVDLATYELAATAPNFQRWTTTTVVKDEGKTVTVAITMRHVQTGDVEAPPGHDTQKPAPVPVVVGPAKPSTAAPTIAPDEHNSDVAPAPHSHRKAYAIVFVAGGGALLAGGLFAGHAASTKWTDAKAVCGSDRTCDDDAELAQANSLASQARTRGTISDGLVGAGVVAIGVGVFLLLTPHDEVRPATALRLAPQASPSSVGLTLMGGF